MPVEQERQYKVYVANTAAISINVANTPLDTLPMPQNGVEDSTDTTLLATASFVGSVFDTSNFKRIIGSCFSDQDGSVFIEQSYDGTDWDISSSYAYSANEKLGIDISVVATYARARFVNGAVDQTIFRMNIGGSTL